MSVERFFFLFFCFFGEKSLTRNIFDVLSRSFVSYSL